jgi:hypothetical protein
MLTLVADEPILIRSELVDVTDSIDKLVIVKVP